MRNIWIYLNGKFCKEEEAKICVTDHGLLFGEGIFTTIRVENGKCELYERHLTRLQEGTHSLEFEWDPFQRDILSQLIDLNGAQKNTWRLKIVVTVKDEREKRLAGNVFAFLEPYEIKSSKPCSLCLFPYPIESLFSKVKTLSYIDHLFVRNFAIKQGHVDSIKQDHQGRILETGCSNLFWINNGTCYVPHPKLPYLQGVFLQALLQNLSFPIQFVKSTLNEIPETASVYLCNAMTHVRIVNKIEKIEESIIRFFPRSSEYEEEINRATQKALAIHIDY